MDLTASAPRFVPVRSHLTWSWASLREIQVVVGDQMEQQELLNRIRHAISVYHFHNPQECFLVQVCPCQTNQPT